MSVYSQILQINHQQFNLKIIGIYKSANFSFCRFGMRNNYLLTINDKFYHNEIAGISVFNSDSRFGPDQRNWNEVINNNVNY